MNKIELLDKNKNVVLTIFKNCKIKSSNAKLKKAISLFITDEKSRIESEYEEEIIRAVEVDYKKGSDVYLELLYLEILSNLIGRSKTPKAYVRMVVDYD